VAWGETRWEAEGGKEVGEEKNYHVSSATPPYPTYQVAVKAPLFPPVITIAIIIPQSDAVSTTKKMKY
jgi:hypothetical protein